MNKEDALKDLLLTLSSLYTDDYTLEVIDEITQLLGQGNITMYKNSWLVCHRCGSINAPKYQMRRLGTKYIALCEDGSGGCASKEMLPPCGFYDQEGVRCTQPACFWLAPSSENNPEDPSNKHSCISHIGAVLEERHTFIGKH